MHKCTELSEFDRFLCLSIDLLDGAHYGLLVDVLSEREQTLELLDGYLAVSIDIEHAEGGLKALTRQEGVLVERGHPEFRVIDLAVPVDVNLFDDLLDLLLVVVDTLDFAEGQLYLVGGEGATAVLIKLLELLCEVVELLLCEHGLDKEAEHGLLDFGVPSKFLQIVQRLREV